MATDKAPVDNSTQDKAKLALSGLALLAGVVLFYQLNEDLLFYRVAAIVGMTVVAGALFFTTVKGHGVADFLRGSRVELQKMVWPTRTETLHSTLVVFVALLLTAIFLWLVDMFLAWFMQMVIR